MSWIYVQVGEPDEARQVLLKAKEATGVDTFKRNWEHLSNDRVKSFSNAGLGTSGMRSIWRLRRHRSSLRCVAMDAIRMGSRALPSSPSVSAVVDHRWVPRG